MSMKQAFIRYRPSRTEDGQGGFTETTGDGAVFYGSLEIHEEMTTIEDVDAYEDVQVGDVLLLSL